MNKGDTKKVRTVALVISIMITLLELYFIFTIKQQYKGVYNITFFLILVLSQPIWYSSLFKNKPSLFKLIYIATITIAIPIGMYYSLPKYSYEAGKKIIEDKIGENKEVNFVSYGYDKSTIPTTDKHKNIFLNNRVYYYEVKLNGNSTFFAVEPTNGQVKEVEKDYWSEKYKSIK